MRIPIHWLAIYVSLFFSVAWASRCRPKTVEFAMMVSSKNRANYWLMMYFVTMIQVVLNFALIGLTLMICVLLCGGNMTMLPSTQFVERYVSLSEPALRLENIAIAYIALPFAASCSLAAIQVALSQFIGITKSYCIIVTILVISSFIDLWALPGSCLMMIRNIYIMSDLRLAATGFAVVAITMIAAYILGYVRIKKCDLSHHKLV
jgi:hypothetical protein